MEGWTVTELAERLNLKPPTISGWIRAGLVEPLERRGGRAGHVVGIVGVFELITVAELRDVGFSNFEIRKAVRELRLLTGDERPLATQTLVLRGNDIAWQSAHESGRQEVSALRQPGQHLMVLSIGERYEEVLHQLQEPLRETAGVGA